MQERYDVMRLHSMLSGYFVRRMLVILLERDREKKVE